MLSKWAGWLLASGLSLLLAGYTGYSRRSESCANEKAVIHASYQAAALSGAKEGEKTNISAKIKTSSLSHIQRLDYLKSRGLLRD